MRCTVQPFAGDALRPDLLALWDEGLERPSIERYRALYESALSPGIRTHLLFVNDGDPAAGCLSIFPRTFSLAGKKVTFGVNADLIIRRRYRTIGPALRLLSAQVEECSRAAGPGAPYDALLAMPSHAAETVFVRAGYRKIGEARRWGKVLCAGRKVAAVVPGKTLPRLVAAGLDLCSRWLTAEGLVLAAGGRPAVRIDLPCRDLAALEPRFSAAFGTDTARFAAWRYGRVSMHETRIFAVGTAAALQGYVIYHIHGTEAVVEDFGTAAGASRKMLLARFIESVRRRSLESISLLCFGERRFERLLAALGFIRREGRGVYLYPLGPGPIELPPAGISLFDGDLDL